MQAHRIEAIVDPDGSVTVAQVPFRPGERVEVVVLPAPKAAVADEEHPLRNSILRYDRPTDPVADDQWKVHH